jgi:4-hydroxybenzoate polyprenyltransferase
VTAPLLTRLATYQSERFPLLRTATLVLVFSASSVSVSAHLAGRAAPAWPAYLGAFAATLILFWHLRVLDEIKDAEDDRLYRPERPIPRGLVSLALVVRLGLATVPLALIAAAAVDPRLALLLAAIWGWMALMTAEFFVPAWLKRRPFAYLVSHMMVMPLIDLFVTGFEWLPRGGAPGGLALFLGLSFANGCVLEIGRKLWAPEHERPGVDSYSALLGPRRGALVWIACLSAAFALLVAVGFATRAPLLTGGAGLVGLAGAAWTGLAFARAPTPAAQKRVDAAAGLWVLICYVAAAAAPFASAPA